MAVKFDKDLILKHRFWILIGVFVILALVPPFLLTTSVSDAVEKKRGEYDNAKKAVDGITTPKNEKWVAAAEKKDGYVADKKKEMHEKAWRSQAGMMTYPESLAPIMQPKYFGDSIEYHDLDKYGRDYNTQLKDAVVDVQPLLPQEGFENGVVQFAGNSINGVLKLDVAFEKPLPSKEDFWLAQEDLWMKRELLRIIRDANDSVARFHAADEEQPPAEVKKPAAAGEAKPAEPTQANPAPAADAKPGSATEPKPAEGTPPAATPADGAAPPAPKPAPKPVAKKPVDLNHRIFRNQHWELDLTLKPDQSNKKFSVGGTIKNIGHRRRPLNDVTFKVLLQPGTNASGIGLQMSREPLACLETATIAPKEFNIDLVAYDGLYGVEEILTWKTAPVKRIDALELDYESSRMASRGLKPPRWYTPPPDAAPTDAGEAGGKAAMMGGMGGPGGPGGGSGAPLVSKSGLRLNRYLDTNEQVRHMPVGMVVIADDEHLAELLSAFTNSRLRIQVTQCHWQVCRDKMAPVELSPSSGPGAPATPGLGALANRGPSGKGMGMGMGLGDVRGPGARGNSNNNMFRPPGNRPDGNMVIGSRGGSGPGGRPAGFSRPGSGMAPGGGLAGTGLGGAGLKGGFPGANSAADDEEEESLNLLEVAVYGIASIYEKYPPKPPEAAAPADAAGQPAAPAKP